ncbi:MAG: putative metallopeptidase [archaeon]
MPIKYEFAPDIQERIIEILKKTDIKHIDMSRVFCIRSRGSTASGVIARCYALGKIWQKVLDCKAAYIVEVISERFDRLPKDEQTRTLIHEIMHIPKAFGGGIQASRLCNKKKRGICVQGIHEKQQG